MIRIRLEALAAELQHELGETKAASVRGLFHFELVADVARWYFSDQPSLADDVG
jgi:hypothetical protein